MTRFTTAYRPCSTLRIQLFRTLQEDPAGGDEFVAACGRLPRWVWVKAVGAMWSEIDILVNPYAETPYRRVGALVRAMSTADVAVRHPEAFVVASDVTL